MRSKNKGNNVLTQFKQILIVILFICTNFTVIAQEDKQEEIKTTVKHKKVAIPLPVSIELQHKEDLTHYLPTNNVASILAGPDDYLTLIDENTSVNNKGVAILLPDWQQGAVNPKAINFLRTALPKQGWTTISIQPPNKPSNFPSKALKVDEQKQANKIIIDDYKKKLSALINAVLTKSQEYPGIVIIIAQGNHGAMLVDIFDQQSTNQNGTTPTALILLSSYLLNNNELINETNTVFAKKLAYSEYPILDLYLKYDNPIVLDKTAQRLAIANQELKAYYRQRQINNNATGYYPEQELLIQINSWLRSIGW
ncbi:MAG: DUF3530 family protein [Colwellia sp.]|nr:DUF3530 family protein [Colwellia sp.]